MDKEKKEIWKLLELYRNYLTDEIKKEMYVNWADKECIDMFEADEVEEERLYKFLNQLSVLKKFIKWLVENDKIRYEKVREQVDKEPMSIGRWLKYNILLMLLAIQDEPIRFLCEIIK